MSSTAPLAALLASHPEEVGAVVAVLATRMDQQGATLADIREALTNFASTIDDELARAIVNAGIEADLIKINPWCECRIEAADRYAIARHPRGVMGWLRARVGTGPRQPLYADQDAIAVRVASVLDCDIDDVCLKWRSSNLDRIEVKRGSNSPELSGADVAALIAAGFEPGELGWDVPGDVSVTDGEEQAKR